MESPEFHIAFLCEMKQEGPGGHTLRLLIVLWGSSVVTGRPTAAWWGGRGICSVPKKPSSQPGLCTLVSCVTLAKPTSLPASRGHRPCLTPKSLQRRSGPLCQLRLRMPGQCENVQAHSLTLLLSRRGIPTLPPRISAHLRESLGLFNQQNASEVTRHVSTGHMGSAWSF